jgi:hypothetical protein
MLLQNNFVRFISPVPIVDDGHKRFASYEIVILVANAKPAQFLQLVILLQARLLGFCHVRQFQL